MSVKSVPGCFVMIAPILMARRWPSRRCPGPHFAAAAPRSSKRRRPPPPPLAESLSSSLPHAPTARASANAAITASTRGPAGFNLVRNGPSPESDETGLRADRTDNWLLTATNCSVHRNNLRAAFSARGLGSRRRRGDRRAQPITSRPAARRPRREPAPPCGALRGDRTRLRAAAHRAARRGARAGPEPPPRAGGRGDPPGRRAAARDRPGGRDRRRVPPLHVHGLLLRQRRRPAGRRRRRAVLRRRRQRAALPGPAGGQQPPAQDRQPGRARDRVPAVDHRRALQGDVPLRIVLRAALRLQERRHREGVRQPRGARRPHDVDPARADRRGGRGRPEVRPARLPAVPDAARPAVPRHLRRDGRLDVRLAHGPLHRCGPGDHRWPARTT